MTLHHKPGHPPTRRRWPAVATGAVIAFTALVLCFQLYHAKRIAAAGGSRRLMLWKRKLHRTVHHSEYRSHLPELLAAAEPHFVAFTSGLDGAGNPWCRDCRAAMPVIREIVLGAGGSLLEVSVGEPSDWRSRQHPVRVDPDCPVHYVPTLYYWRPEGAAEGAGCGSSLANPLSSDETTESLRVIVAKFVRETAAGKRYVDRITREVIDSGGKDCGGC